MLPNWDHGVEQWLARLNLLCQQCPDLQLPPITEDDQKDIIEQLCHGAVSYKDIKEREVKPIVMSWLSPAQRELLDRHAPERLTLPNGRTPKVIYEAGKPPFISLRIEELYDVNQTPKVALGRVPVTRGRSQRNGPTRRPGPRHPSRRNFRRCRRPVRMLRQRGARLYENPSAVAATVDASFTCPGREHAPESSNDSSRHCPPHRTGQPGSDQSASQAGMGNYFGLPIAFWNWYHRQYKQSGDRDIGKDFAKELYEQWLKEGEPDAEGHRTKPITEPVTDTPVEPTTPIGDAKPVDGVGGTAAEYARAAGWSVVIAGMRQAREVWKWGAAMRWHQRPEAYHL